MPFALLGLVPWRVWLYAGVIAAVGAVGLYEWHRVYQEGVNAEIQKINDANAIEQGRADAAQTTVDGCFNSGGAWDRASGKCLRDQPAGQ